MTTTTQLTCDDIDFDAIEPAELEQMMVQSGWEKIKTFAGIATIWRSAITSTTQWVPLNHNFDDYAKLARETYVAATTDNCIKRVKAENSAA